MVDKYDVNIVVFFNVDDIYWEFVFSFVEKFFWVRSVIIDDIFLNEIVIDIYFLKFNLIYVILWVNGLDSIILKVMNIILIL